MILRHNVVVYACLLIHCAVTAFGQVSKPTSSSSNSGEESSTIMELPAKSDAKMPLKVMAPSESFSGSYFFLIERSAPSLSLLTVRAADSKRILANCQFDNRPLDINNNNKNNNNHESRWLMFEWQIEDGLLRCHTPESETFFKLDEPVGGNTSIARPTGYVIDVTSANTTVCVRELMTPGLLAPLRCTMAMMGPHGVQCGCSLLDTPAADAVDAASAEFPLLHNLLVSPSNNGAPLPSPVAFPMFRPEPSPRAVHLPQPTDGGLDNTAPIFDHLKVAPLATATVSSPAVQFSTTNTDAAAEKTTPIAVSGQLTPPPEIRIRGTRPPFHFQSRQTNTTDLLTTLARGTTAFAEPEIFDISDMRAINDKVVFAVDTSPRTVTTTAASAVCMPKCEMGGVCVSTPNGGAVCRCTAGFLGRNCNIRNPCANVSTCTDHYGAAARCIVDADAMAEKAPPVFVEAPHLCYCRDDNNDWKSCDELFNMEFGTAVTDSTTPVVPPTPARPAVVDELGAFRRLTANATIAVDDTTSTPIQVPTDQLPEFPLHSNATSPSDESSEPGDERSSIDSSDDQAGPAFTDLPILPVESQRSSGGNFSSSPSTLIHLATPTMATATTATTTTTASSHAVEDASPRVPIAVALPIPTGAENGSETESMTSVHPTTVSTTVFLTEKTTSPIDAEGDNGFERITQHIQESSRGEMTDEMENGQTEIGFENVSPSAVGFAPHEDGSTFTNNNFITPDVSPPEAEIEDGLSATTILAVTKVTPMTNTQNIPITTEFVKERSHVDVSVTPSHIGTPYRSVFQSSAASWIIGVGVLGTGGACVGRYVRRSRRLHGKYNPSREESALATAYAMPMTTVGKEERLI